jgi:SAM-dependent methyltransferase
MESRKEHWEKVYETKQPNEVSWTQEKPETSLAFIAESGISKSASIIDIGGGDSKLVDFLLELGFSDITVLDISKHALERAKARLGKAAEKVNWIEADINEFQPAKSYDLWHDRAVFHFLTSNEEQKRYVDLVNEYVSGTLIIGTFSQDGPLKCSGLEIQQYSESLLTNTFEGLEKVMCKSVNHITPFDTTQNFVFCSFRKRD